MEQLIHKRRSQWLYVCRAQLLTHQLAAHCNSWYQQTQGRSAGGAS